MRKAIVFLLSMMLVIGGIPAVSSAEALTVDVQKLVYNGKEFIPLRETFEGLGYKVDWVDALKTVEIEKGNETVHIRADERYMLRNGVLVDGVSEPVIINGRMFISLQSAGELFNMYWFISSSQLRVYDGLKSLDAGIPKLKSKLEYEKLMSFYPNRNDYYMGFEGDMIMDIPSPPMNEKMIEEEVAMEPMPIVPDISETNVQVEGVDEADIVKIDGKYIYALKKNELQIIRTVRGNLEVVRTLKEEGFYPEQLFINEDKLILIGRETSTSIKTYEDGDRIITIPEYRSNVLMVKCYDKSKLEFEAPKLIKAFGVEGHYISSRMVEDYVYVVANRNMGYGIPVMPMVMETNDNRDTSGTRIAYDEISYFPGHVSGSMFYTMGIDLNDLSSTGLDVDAYLGGGQDIYADRDSLYVALRSNSGMWWRDWSRTTDIYSFDLDKGKVDPKSRGSVPGYIINQFAMDEYDGHFRIATTSWGSEDVTRGNTTLNNLYILDGDLKQVGSVENLAPGERIYSTRMMGDKVYIVTYRQVDPFYVIDASNPENPSVLGYLKIPGYSSYLHPYDDKTIIGIGMETRMEGSRVVNDGVKVSVFDVSDFSNPVEKDKVILGRGGSSSDVGYDHRAFLFNREKNIMAFPARVFYGSGSRMSKDAYVFSFKNDGTLNLRGAISHASLSEGEKVYYDYNDGISRIMYIGDDLYTMSNNWIRLNDLDSLEAIDSLKR